MRYKTIEEIDVSGRRVFVRVDFNVPIANGVVKDETRIRASLPTLRYLLERRATLILASHMGRPKGQKNPNFSLSPVAPVLQTLLGREVRYLPDCVGDEIAIAVRSAPAGSVLLLENLRFHPGEEANDPVFAGQLASLGEVYVNDAFGTAARAHASTVGIVAHLSMACAGLLMMKELRYLGKLLETPERPFCVILGGAKISDKIRVVDNLLKIANTLLIGGGMAFTFLASRGASIGDSICERDQMGTAEEVLRTAKSRGVDVYLPLDQLVSRSLGQPIEMKIVPATSISEGWRGVDIGPGTVQLFQKPLREAKTIFWNGPMGIFEVQAFSGGTVSVARSVAQSEATTVVGGGDSVAAIAQAGVSDKITHISTGGGASLELLAGHSLPGVVALSRQD